MTWIIGLKQAVISTRFIFRLIMDVISEAWHFASHSAFFMRVIIEACHFAGHFLLHISKIQNGWWKRCILNDKRANYRKRRQMAVNPLRNGFLAGGWSGIVSIVHPLSNYYRYWLIDQTRSARWLMMAICLAMILQLLDDDVSPTGRKSRSKTNGILYTINWNEWPTTDASTDAE